MEGSAGAAPQRVCPNCARISWAMGPQCPYCRASFRRKTAPQFAWMLTAAVLAILAGVLAMLLIAGHAAQNELDNRVTDVQRQFDTSLAGLRTDFQKELDQRLPQDGAVPTPVPSDTPTPEATETPSPSPGASATPSPSSTPPGARSKPTPTPTPIIQP
jgi:hypothetical protein